LPPRPAPAPCASMMSCMSPLPADEESPDVATFREQLDHQIGEVQLPEAILGVMHSAIQLDHAGAGAPLDSRAADGLRGDSRSRHEPDGGRYALA
jgi:hypothetical protein